MVILLFIDWFDPSIEYTRDMHKGANKTKCFVNEEHNEKQVREKERKKEIKDMIGHLYTR